MRVPPVLLPLLQRQPTASPFDPVRPGTTNAWIEEAEISDVALMECLDRAYLRPLLQPSGRIGLRTESGLRVLVSVHAEQRGLQMSARFQLASSATPAQRQSLVTRINDRYCMVRASLDSDGDLYLDYWLAFAGGLLVEQFLFTLRRFGIVAMDGVHAADTENVVG